MTNLGENGRYFLFLLAVLSFAAFGSPSVLWAQAPGPSPEPFDLQDQSPDYVTETWSVDDGLPLNVIWTIDQTRDGMLWMGTLDGLARFDGRSFTTHTAPDTDGLAGNRVVGLHEDESGTLWIGTDTGVSRYRNGTFEEIESPTGHIENFSEGAQGTIWMGGRPGLYRWLEAEGTERLPLPEELQNGSVKVEAAGRDSVWVASDETLRLYSGGSYHRPGWLQRPLDGTIHNIAASANRLVVATDSVIVSVQNGTVDRYPHQGGTVGVVHVAPSGDVWLTTHRSGLLRLSKDSLHTVRMDGTIGDRLHGLTHDENGQWWVGDHNQGLVRLRPRLFHAVNGGASGGARGVYNSNDGTVWGGIGTSGLFRFTDSTQTQWTPSNGLPGEYVRPIGQDESGTLWAGTNQGLARLRGDHFEKVTAPDGGDLENMSALQRDSTGTLWIASQSKGLYKYRSESLEQVLPADSLSGSRVMGLLRAQDGALWIGTRDLGVARLREGNQIDWYDTDDGVPYQSVRDIYQTAAGTIWISTSGGGIARFEGDHFTPVTPDDGLPHRSIHVIREAPKGIFWMSSNGGVFRVPQRQVEAVADGRRDRLYAQEFGRDEGMPAREFNGPMHPVLAQDWNSRLWIPTVDGFAVVDPHSSQLEMPDSMPVRVTNVRVDGASQSLDSLRFAPPTYRLAFDFSAISLRHADDLSFRYRLDNEPWTRAQSRRTAEFTNLESGSHQFQVQATLNGDRWYTLETPVRFTIAPHFWETGWFRLLVVLGLFGVIAGVYRWRTYRLRKRQEDLEAAVQERTHQLQVRTEELAEEKRKTERQAERLAELDEAKNRFFAHISHEFRTPLSLILSPLHDGLRKERPLGTAEMKRMARNAERLQQLIDQLLDLATLEAGQMSLEPEPGALGPLVKRIAEAHRSRAEQKDVDLTVQTPPTRVETQFDPEKVETIVSNLLGNALKFTPEGGAVSVRMGTSEETGPVEPPGNDGPVKGAAWIEVVDTGPGIDPDVQSQIFDRFEQADNSATRDHEGTGLGLALTKELVELHGGSINLESRPGEGSSFTVWLPLLTVMNDASVSDPTPDGETLESTWSRTSRPSVAAEDERSEVSPNRTNGKQPSEETAKEAAATILVVEDNPEMRTYLREQLAGHIPSSTASQNAGHWRVLEAVDGEEAWEIVQENAPDLVVSDVMMPGLDGFELCRRIKADPERRSIPVLLVTARADQEGTLEGLEVGADDYLSKPSDAEELRQRISNHLAARQHLQEQYQTHVQIAAFDATVPAANTSFTEQVLETIAEHLQDPDFTVAQLADEMALSRRQLTRRIKEALDRTPGALIRECRVKRAKTLLAQNPATIAEVAYAVGFRSPSSFSQTFRKVVGSSPSAYTDGKSDR